MKPLISYYGGKQRIVKHILKYIPEHKIYVEAFSGGATVFFAKPLAEINILNDKNKWLVNMYVQYKKKPKLFARILRELPFSEHLHKISKKYKIKNKMISAVRFWYNINNGFSHRLNSGWKGLAKDNTRIIEYINRLKRLLQPIKKLKHASIYCRKALKIIKFYDSENTFFYLDPPYPNANQGHYKGYTIENYKQLIELLKTLKGKFILSNYHQDIEYPKEWKKVEIETYMSAAKNKREKRNEILYMNYDSYENNTLFD